MKRRHSEKGMALVITLMMLAIVTFMAVVFLSLSRRERTNVKLVEDQATARMMTDVALDRAKADMVGTMNNAVEAFLGTATNNPQFGVPTNQQHVAVANRAVQRGLLQYDLRTSKNFFNPRGFRRQDGSKPWNVGYYDDFGNWYDDRDKRIPSNTAEYYQNIANLQYDPRPPVIVTDGKTNDFRFYIDLNRNGMFDRNGVQKITGPNNEEYAPNGKFGTGLVGNFVGDPEWIGVLERPDLPHSETNRFIGRYAYLMMPTGKSLDINFIHNLAVFNTGDTNITYNTSSPRYSRNQGVGSWEMNMAAFLVDLHTNVWRPNQTFYRLTTNSASGQAFKDSVGLMQYRLNYSRGNLLTARQVFGGNQLVNRWQNDYVDEAGDGPYVPYNFWYASARPNFDLSKAGVNPDNDQDVRFWHGAERMDRTGEIPDVQRYFKLNSATAPTELLGFYSRFTNAVSNSKTNTYDRYAYYRLLSQMGADSRPAIQNKIHLNFTNEPGTISTNLVPWTMITNNGVAEPTVMLRQPTAVKVVRNDGGEEYQTRTNSLTNFFLIAADAMLRESLVTNIYLDNFGKWRTNYTIGCSYFDNPSLNTVWNDPLRVRRIVATPVRPDISITNIQIFHKLTDATLWRPNDLTYTNNEYDASLHRILQLAANIFDNMTNNAGSRTHRRDDPFFPTAWRPLYSISPTNITITGWEPQFDANFALKAVVTNASLFRSPREYFTNQNVIITNVSFFGQPWVIGVKKGWPNFNEFSIETYAQITRKLEVLKDAPGEKMALTNSGATLANFAKHTRQIFMVGFSNTFGLEAWNSYALTNHRTIRIDAEVEVTFGVERVTRRDSNNPAIVLQSHPAFQNPNVVKLFASSYTIQGSTGWPGRRPDTDLTNAIPPNGNPPNASSDGKSDFRVPIYTNAPVFPPTPGIDSWTAREYTDLPPPYGGFFAKPATWQFLNTTPDLRLNVTNRVRYLATDVTENRVLDYVTFDNLATAIDLDQALHGERNYGNQLAGASGANVVNPSMFWDTTPVQNSNAADGFTQGIMNQLQVSLGNIGAAQKDWKNYSIFDTTDLQIKDFSDYINGVNTNATIATNIVRQVPFSPTRTFYLQTLYQANDPLVHYMVSDLIDPSMLTRPTPGVPIRNPELGHRNKRRQAIRFDGLHSVSFQDPRVLESDDWQFPIAKIDDPTRNSTYGIENFHYRYPNIGALGQVHRGTPWQTVYLKAGMAPNAVDLTLNTNVPTWYKWAGSYGTHPTNDWRLVGLFTTAMTENAARGLLSVNQSHTAAWSAVLSGVPVITNSIPDNKYRVNPKLPPQFGVPSANYGDLMIEPGSVQLSNIVRNINQYRSTRAMGVFSYMGEILGTPMLSIGANLGNGALQGSPYLNLSDAQIKDTRGVYDFHALTDEALEAIPARILSLLKEDEPRVTIYCFGQTLKPAPRSFVTSADFYNLCVNYQVTGEYVTKAVVRVEGEFKNPDNPIKTVVESFEVLAPFE